MSTDLELPEMDACCQTPCDLPWIDHKQCMIFKDARTSTVSLGSLLPNRDVRGTLTVRVEYTHTLCLIGKQQGGLVYTLTLLPGETATLFHSDRLRRTTSEEQRFSITTTFAQFTSALDQRRKTGDESRLDRVATGKVDASASGSLDFDFDFSIEGSGSFSSTTKDTLNIHTTKDTSDEFHSTLQQASQFTDMKRSITVSSFEDKETIDTTKRTLFNNNKCYAVNYFVRKILDVYEVSTKVTGVTVEIVSGHYASGPLTIEQLGQLPSAFRAAAKAALANTPPIGETVAQPTRVSVPTDGVVYLPELAHCCVQDPLLEAAGLVALEREKAEARKIAMEAELLALEVQRRQALLAAGTLEPFMLAGPAPVEI